MMRWRLGGLFFIIVSLALAEPAPAQVAEDIELNLFAGGSAYTANSFEIGFPQSVTPIPARFRLDGSIRGGVRFNVFTSGHWGQEFYYSYEPNEGHYRRETLSPEELDLGLQVHNFGVNGLYYFSDDETLSTRPFASFGLGAAIYKPTAETRSFVRDPQRGNLTGFDQSNELAFNYGLGLKHRFSSVFGLRLDVRHFISRFPSFSLARHSDDPNAVVFPADGAIHNLEATAGITFYFGR